MSFLNTEKFLWVVLSSVVLGVFVLGFSDPTLRPQVLDFAKVALGAVLTAMTATINAKPK